MSPPPRRLIVATRNDHKLRELGEILIGIELVPLPLEIELPPETGETFTENALIKARAAHAATGRPALADDSGIGAEPLGWAPGIYSARYAGEDATDEENLAKLLREAPDGSPVAYVCAIAYVDDATEHVVEARCEGTLTHDARGSGGFGYDPAFVPREHPDRTMAELSDAEKHAISHRGRAARKLAERLGLAEGPP